jgi:hypothetical protein
MPLQGELLRKVEAVCAGKARVTQGAVGEEDSDARLQQLFSRSRSICAIIFLLRGHHNRPCAIMLVLHARLDCPLCGDSRQIEVGLQHKRPPVTALLEVRIRRAQSDSKNTIFELRREVFVVQRKGVCSTK